MSRQFWRHQICKLYQNIASTLRFMIVFGIHCNFFIDLHIQLKTCRSVLFFFLFFFFTIQNVCSQFWALLRGFARPSAQFIQACIYSNILIKQLKQKEKCNSLVSVFWESYFWFYSNLESVSLIQYITFFIKSSCKK